MTTNLARWYEPSSIEQAKELAGYLAKSGLVPRDYENDAPRCFVAMMHGARLGIAPLEAIQNIVVVHGRPTIMGRMALACVMAHPAYAGKSEEITGGTKDEPLRARVVLRRRITNPEGVIATGAVDEGVGEFSIEDAARAGLVKKGGSWSAYPRDMLLWRARARAIAAAFPDALSGLPLAELERENVKTADAEVRDAAPDRTPAAEAAAKAIAVATGKIEPDFSAEEADALIDAALKPEGAQE